MPRKSRHANRRRLTPLTHSQVEILAETICGAGDERKERGEALLVLMHEIGSAGEIGSVEEINRVVDIATIAKHVAFENCGAEAIDAQADLLRGEICQ